MLQVATRCSVASPHNKNAMAEPAKLQLLTHKPGETGFQLHEIHSSQAYLGYRPQRVAQESWAITAQPKSPDGRHNYVLKNLQYNRYLLIDEKELFLWEFFDGSHSLEEIARSFHHRFGAFDYSVIRQLLPKLHQAGLLVERENLALKQILVRSQTSYWATGFSSMAKCWRRLCFTVPDADQHCAAIYRYGGFVLFHRITLYLTIFLAILAGITALRLSPQAKQFTQLLSATPWRSGAIMLAVLLAASMLHVLIHALACKSYKRRVREIGFFLLQGVLPTFYADVTDIFMSTRRARVVVDLAGPMVEVALGSVALFGIGVLLWESALINLYPFNFLEMDGYNIVADLLAMPTLRQQALALMPNLPRRLLRMKSIQRAEWIQIGYLLLCFVSVLVYVIAHLDAVRALFPRWN
jgi:putative peptide zinc metalloprotease protein